LIIPAQRERGFQSIVNADSQAKMNTDSSVIVNDLRRLLEWC